LTSNFGRRVFVRVKVVATKRGRPLHGQMFLLQRSDMVIKRNQLSARRCRSPGETLSGQKSLILLAGAQGLEPWTR
jgi:hypothetical protein